MTGETSELQASTTAWQIAMQEILRMVIRDMYRSDDTATFETHIKRIEEEAVDSIYKDLRLRGTTEWTENSCKRKGDQHRHVVANLVYFRAARLRSKATLNNRPERSI